jgi:hypothetical protein
VAEAIEKGSGRMVSIEVVHIPLLYCQHRKDDFVQGGWTKWFHNLGANKFPMGWGLARH